MDYKKSILAISGSGRSGTTIMSVLMSQSTDVLNFGQSRDFWRAFAENRTCTCSETLQECELWSAIAKTAFNDWARADYEKIDEKMRAFMNAAANTPDWSQPKTLNGLAETHSEYISAVRILVETCFEISGARTLIDISKSPEIALSFHLAAVAEIFVLNVVRDPRAVACSWAKKGLKGAVLDKQIDAWKVRQLRLAQWPATSGLQHQKLDYRMFARRPQTEVSNVMKWVSQGKPYISELQFDQNKTTVVSWGRQHLFPPANEKVLAEKKTEITIRAPKAWRGREYLPLHLRTLWRTFPAGIKYILGFSVCR